LQAVTLTHPALLVKKSATHFRPPNTPLQPF